MEKSDLLDRLRRGDDALLKEIYDKHKMSFIRWAVRFGLNRNEAEDVFQISVVILYDNVITGKLQTLSSSLKTYLFSIGKHKSMELKRGNKNALLNIDSAALEIILEEPETEDTWKFDVEQVREALVRLGDPCKRLLELMYYNKLSQDVISEMMGYKDRDTVKSKKYKCIARLKKILENPDNHESDIS